MNITVLYNKPTNKYNEADADTLYSVQEITGALENNGHQTNLLGIDKSELKNIRKINSDLVFNLVEWTGKEYQYGVEAVRQLEELGIPFTGSDSRGYRLTCDKVTMKRMMEKYGIPTPKYQIFVDGNETVNCELNYPLIVKPAHEHCSTGVTQNSIVFDKKSLMKQVNTLINVYNQPVVCEEYIKGKEIQITLLEQAGRPMVLPAIEVKYSGDEEKSNILTYDCKWKENSEEYKAAWVQQAELPQEVMKTAIRVAKKCARTLGGRDYPRVDMRIDNDRIFVLEINNNPGIGDDEESCIGYSSKLINWDFNQLINHIVENAVRRWGGKITAYAI